MRQNLALVLTQPMLDELCAIACDCQSDRSLYFRDIGQVAPDNFIGTRAALEKRGARFEEQLAIMKGLWTQDRLTFRGAYYTVDGRLEPKPIAKPHPPVWIGGWGALARVYLNIGTNWEQWNQLHLPVVGFQPQRPFLIDDVKKHSVYWHATQIRVAPMRDYFLQVTPSMPLVDARTSAESADDVEQELLSSIAVGGDGVFTLTDERGRRVLIPVSKIAYVDLGEENARHVGFGAV